MKTLFTSALILAVSIFSFASPLDKKLREITNIETEDQKVNINFKEAMGKVTILILDQKGKKLAKNTYITKQAVKIPYDLSGLPEGDYGIKIVTSFETAQFNIENRKTPEAPKAPVRKLLAYGKIMDNNTLNLLVVGIEKPGITVEIIDENGKRIKRDFIKEKDGFTRDYKLKNLQAEKLYMVVSDTEGRSKKILFN